MVINLLAIKFECREGDCLQFCCLTSEPILSSLKVEEAGGEILGIAWGDSLLNLV